jgi:hypothetical protein
MDYRTGVKPKIKIVFFWGISIIRNTPLSSPVSFCSTHSTQLVSKMPTWPPSPLPLDVLNVLLSFLGDRYHFLTCVSLTPQGNLSHSRFFMQSRKHAWTCIGNLCNRRSRQFHYCYDMVYPTLHVKYGYVTIREDTPVFENRLERLKAILDFTIRGPEHTAYIKNEIRGELAKKYAKNIGRMKLSSRLIHK